MSKTPTQFIQPIVISVREMWTYLWGEETDDAPASQPDPPVIYEASVTLDEIAAPPVDGATGQTPHAETQSTPEPPPTSVDTSLDTHGTPSASST